MRYYLWIVVTVVALLVVSGCGGNSSQIAPTPTPKPVTAAFSNAILNGQYAFVLSQPAVAAGSFQADGNGNLTNGMMDIATVSAANGQVPFTGTYSVLANGEGTATLVVNGLTALKLNFFLVSRQHLLVTNFINCASPINCGSPLFGTGNIDLQDPTTFSAAALKGQFAFSVVGNIDLAGGFVLDGVNAISSGLHDAVDPSHLLLAQNQPLTGTYNISSGTNGRGTLTENTALGVQTFAFYIVSKGHLMLMQTGTNVSAGEAFTGFDPTPQNPGCGPCVYAWDSTFFIAEAHLGLFTHDGAGNITGGTQDSSTGCAPSTQETITGGAMTFGSPFRYQMTLIIGGKTSTVAAYPSTGGLLLFKLEVQHLQGVALNQSPGVPLNQSLEGTYGFAGDLIELGPGCSLFDNGTLGQFTTNDPGRTGAGTVSGTWMVNNALPEASLTGSFSMDSNGRGTIDGQSVANAQSPSRPLHLILRAATSNKLLFITSDIGDVSMGTVELQSPQ